MNAIEVKSLRKTFPGFALDVSFSVPMGYVCGFVGRNGAGKTTTLKSLLGMAIPDYADIRLLGKDVNDASVKADLGVLFDQPYFQESWTARDIEKVLRLHYPNWNSDTWWAYLKRFGLPDRRKFKDLSRGMKMKLGLSASLAHDAKLLLLDEPTGGLDPVVREEVLDILREYMLDESHSIFFSTHITSDLEKIADRIIFMSNGKIVFDDDKNSLTERYAFVHGGGYDELRSVDNLGILPANVLAETPTLDDIVVYFERGNVK
jgi:ABC-2 type transport system ATP-binding protein